MTDTSKSQAVNVSYGTTIRGKWNKESYQIEKKLGSGALGTVYLANSRKGHVAVKVGNDTMSISSEVNVLKQLSQVQGSVLGPFFYEMDDWEVGGKRYPFYVMEYIHGEPLFSFIQRRGKEWLGILMLQLLRDLSVLHREGWVFGDLKPDNLLVEGAPPKMRWLDVGGTTVIGRSVKEFTEFFDRGYWGLGSRVAEPSYDLFATAMVVINAAYPKRFERPKENAEAYLMSKVDASSILKPYKSILRKALKGKYQNALEMRNELFTLLQDDKPKAAPKVKATSRVTARKRTVKAKNKRIRWVETVLLFAFILTLYTLYLVGYGF
ncbi:serine/threonine protein kinase [Alkalihalobacillus sp. CinArs1]|uniref:serine/threonine protein kinase n=1 Tax=Alkalihalobacillus sp. CinArs1 TaxID=2995314 RepID=UPI0022DE8923|nr:serine/threonine-protein kinase [Alkalihalobacillus sp. CinArs1]